METSSDRTDEEFGDFLEKVRPFVEKIERSRAWYAAHATRPRIHFRTIGVLVILLSLSIPLIAVLKFPGKEIVLSVAAVSIAVATSLNSFFKWEQTWQAFRKTEFALDYLLTQWDLQRVEAMQETDPLKFKQKILEATQQLLSEANKITSSETQEFFDRIEWPKEKK